MSLIFAASGIPQLRHGSLHAVAESGVTLDGTVAAGGGGLGGGGGGGGLGDGGGGGLGDGGGGGLGDGGGRGLGDGGGRGLGEGGGGGLEAGLTAGLTGLAGLTAGLTGGLAAGLMTGGLRFGGEACFLGLLLGFGPAAAWTPPASLVFLPQPPGLRLTVLRLSAACPCSRAAASARLAALTVPAASAASAAARARRVGGAGGASLGHTQRLTVWNWRMKAGILRANVAPLEVPMRYSGLPSRPAALAGSESRKSATTAMACAWSLPL